MSATAVQVKEKPILFSGPMVKAILQGEKTQTRRVVKLPQWAADHDTIIGKCEGHMKVVQQARQSGAILNERHIECPYGAAGDRLWVRETFYAFGHFNYTGRLTRSGDEEMEFVDTTLAIDVDYRYASDGPVDTMESRFALGWHMRPSIFMPRIASRITLEITNVRVERLADISCADVIAEGSPVPLREHSNPDLGVQCVSAKEWFQEGWNRLNGKRKGCSWADNPWVWVLEFRKL